jgi:hypothetical protein
MLWNMNKIEFNWIEYLSGHCPTLQWYNKQLLLLEYNNFID